MKNSIKRSIRPIFSAAESSAIVHEAQKQIIRRLDAPSRRLFLQRGLTLGGVAMLTGCDISDNAGVESALAKISVFNDRVQGWLFGSTRLAPVYAESMITRPFPFNAFYAEDDAPEVDGTAYRLKIVGLALDKREWPLSTLHQMAQVSQVTRHICVEGWSAIGKWGGVPFGDFLRLIGADLSAEYV
ncbi:molybdopterin-dependent oxidoreductase, partial [Acerihabitans sp.]|uniref:molybdopterin-dependent oxidoreductase n=1 Tax=Acerihabitans sp. TaxID=2811394 RepID=UPI002EDAF257